MTKIVCHRFKFCPVLIDYPSCQRSMNSQSNEIIPRTTLHVQGLMLAGRKLEGALSAFCSPDIEVHSTVSQMAGDFIAKVTVKVSERQKWTQFPIFHEWLFTVIDSMFYNDIWELWYTANNTLVIFLGRNDMLNLATVKVYVNSTVRKGTIKLQTSQSTRFLAVKVIKWMETHLPVYSVNFGSTWSYLHSQLPS